jgi:hypothetical protein
MNAVATRPYQVALGSTWSPYSLPGLSPGGSFVNNNFQNNGEKRLVTSDNWGTLGTSSFSVNDLVYSVSAVGALSAALGSLPSTTLLPDETIRCGIGTGIYGGQFAGSLGCAARMANRVYLNGGIAATQTATIAGGPMGRLGFSIGFGGPPPVQQQQQMSSIPGLNRGSSLMELGNSSGSAEAETASRLQNTAKPLGTGLSSPPQSNISSLAVIRPLSNVSGSPDTSDIERLRQRLSDLEKEIVVLRSGNSGGTPEDKVNELKALLKEREARELELSRLLADMQKQLKDQQKTIDLLLKRFAKASK